jgi:hypothetical protein
VSRAWAESGQIKVSVYPGKTWVTCKVPGLKLQDPFSISALNKIL